MFEAFTNWVRNIWEKIMLTRDTIKSVFGVDPPVAEEMNRAIELWANIYANQSPWLSETIRSMNLGAAIASEVARAITIEATVEVEGGPRAEWIEEIAESVLEEVREQAEYAVALGGMVFKPYVDNSGRIVVDYVKADAFYPVEFDAKGTMTGVIFVDKKKIGDNWYTKLEYHQMVGMNCEIKNIAFRSQSESTIGSPVPLTFVPEWSEILPLATVTNIEKPLYAYFRYPLANNIVRGSKLGVSCYSRAVELIEQADRQWSNFLWEFESGQRALYVDALAFGKGPDGKPLLPNKRLYRTLDAGGQEDALFEDWSPSFRQTDLLMGLDAILKRIEFAVGLAYGTLSNPQSVEKTATEILSSKQRTYALVVDTQKALEDALDDLLYAIDVWATLLNLAPKGTWEATFYFDDSIIVDKDQQFKTDMQLVSAGIMPKYEFRMRNLGEDEETAIAKISAVTAETPPLDYPMGA